MVELFLQQEKEPSRERVTSVTILDQAGLEACNTMTVSGHRPDKSI